MPYIPYYKQKPNKSQRDTFDKVTLLVAIVGVVVLSVSAGIMAWQAWETHRTVAQMQDEQRPWVYVADAVSAGPIMLVNSKRYAVPIKFTITNTGHLPAHFVVLKTGAAMATNPIWATKNTVCNAFRNDTGNAGITIFAGQTITYNGFSVDADHPSVSKNQWDSTPGGKLIVIFGCVDYQLPGQPGHHQSRFAFVAEQLHMRGRLEIGNTFPIDPTSVDVKLLPIDIADNTAPD